MAGIYIHIPFCKQACNYCNFHFSTRLGAKGEMLAAIKQELELRKSYLGNETVQTVYIGGGTPSLLEAQELQDLLECLDRSFRASYWKEVTLEANPDDLDATYLRALKHTPINRLSIGVQSFIDKDLAYMNRAHDAAQAHMAIREAQSMGWENISIDLIYGTPTMDDRDWARNLEKALALGVPHISSYALTVEPRTALDHAIKKGTLASPDQARTAGQFTMLSKALEAHGYEHYEISNFAKDGKYALHNTAYWQSKPYLGLGPSAHSYNGESRQWNRSHNVEYIKSIRQDGKVPFEQETLSVKDRFNEYVMVAIRTMWGIDREAVRGRFGETWELKMSSLCETYLQKGWMRSQGSAWVLTREGRLFADGIAASLFV